MGKNPNQTSKNPQPEQSKRQAKLKLEGDDTPTPPPCTDGGNKASGNDLIISIGELRDKLDSLVASAAALQKTPVFSELDSVQAHLKEAMKIVSERDSVSQKCRDKDGEIEKWKNTSMTLKEMMTQTAIEHKEMVALAINKRDEDLEAERALRREIEDVASQNERQLREAYDGSMKQMQEMHHMELSMVQQKLQHVEAELADTKQDLSHSTAQVKCLDLEKSKLEREAEKFKVQYDIAKQRFDSLVFRIDDASL